MTPTPEHNADLIYELRNPPVMSMVLHRSQIYTIMAERMEKAADLIDTIPTWQDISTAPRDSVEVLLYTPCGIGIGIWEDREDDCPDQPGHDAGWYGVGYSCDPIMWGRTEAGGFIGPGYIYEPTNQPTHWMPLPAAPTEGADT